MLETTLGLANSPLKADLDQIADDMARRLNADLALLSFTYNSQLVSLGLSSSVWRAKNDRFRDKNELVCMHTIDRNAPFRMADARKVPQFESLDVVRQGVVAGYMGVPIQNAELGPVGAACVVTAKPRNWSDAEEGYLRAVSRTIEQTILKEMYRVESIDANKALNEYDQIISAFAMVRADATSIHDKTGRLVFANRVLTELVPDVELESPVLLAEITKRPFDGKVIFASGKNGPFELTRHLTASGYIVSQWRPKADRLN